MKKLEKALQDIIERLDRLEGKSDDNPDSTTSKPEPTTTTSKPEPKQPKDGWSLGTHKFGGVTITLLEEMKGGRFRGLIFPTGGRANNAIQTTKLTPALLGAMQELAGEHKAKPAPKQATADKVEQIKRKGLQAARKFAKEHNINAVAHGVRLVYPHLAYVWYVVDGQLYRHRLTLDGVQIAVQEVGRDNLTFWGKKRTKKGFNLYYIEQ